jgi:hypothetical protein
MAEIYHAVKSEGGKGAASAVVEKFTVGKKSLLRLVLFCSLPPPPPRGKRNISATYIITPHVKKIYL